MDVDLIRGLVIIILMVSFAGMAVWLWFFADRGKLEQAARMPLDDNEQPLTRHSNGSEANRTEEGGHE